MVVAIADPLSLDLHDILKFHTSKEIKDVMAVPSQIRRLLERAAGMVEGSAARVDHLIAAVVEEIDGEADAQEAEEEEGESAVSDLVKQIILDAHGLGASDIHIEPAGDETDTRIRLRVDGQCRVYKHVPPQARHRLVARTKILADLDIAEKRRPQDGKIVLGSGRDKIELRVATLPTVGDVEAVVLRVLGSSEPLHLSELGLSDRKTARAHPRRRSHGVWQDHDVALGSGVAERREPEDLDRRGPD
jgi:type II secretory ATPase GspE/PulE/Tfp pilus assembly ATPase PilB-like protein